MGRFLSVTYALVRREGLRSFHSGMWFLGALLFYGIYALYFNLLLNNLSGGQPQPLSPLRWLMGGDLLIAGSLLIPLLVVKAFAEERQLMTFELLQSSGLSSFQLVLGKAVSILIQWTVWMLWLWPILCAIVIYGEITWNQVILSWLGYWMIGCHWSLFGLCVSLKSTSVLAAYSKTAIALLLYYSFPFLKLIWPDPLYRPLFEAMDFRAMADGCAQGYFRLNDIFFLLGGMLFWFALSVARMDLEGVSLRGRLSSFLKWCYHGCAILLLAYVVYLLLFIAHLRPQQWDVNDHDQEKLSMSYRDLAKAFPDDLEVTVVLPANLSIKTYGTTRDLILSFLKKTQAIHPKMKMRILDPDVDLLEMERLQQLGVESQSKIGFVHLRRSGGNDKASRLENDLADDGLGSKGIVLSYHQWISLGVMTLNNEPHHYVREFHGEALMARSINTLTRADRKLKVMALRGFGELDLSDKGRLGGSAFGELLLQLGLQVDWVRPGVDVASLEGYSLLLVLDPRQKQSEVYLSLLEEARTKGIPVLGINSALGYHERDVDLNPWSAYGIDVYPHVVYQRQFANFDEYTLPIHEHSQHEMLKAIQGQMLIMDRCRVIREGIPLDPRFVTRPLLRVHEDERIWGEASARLDEPQVKHRFDGQDLSSPLLVSMLVEKVTKKGPESALILSGSRAPFENRFFYDGANRSFVYECLQNLLGYEEELRLPPRAPVDHRLRINNTGWKKFLWWINFGCPLLILLLWWRGCKS